MVDVTIKNCRIVKPEGVFSAGIAVEKERIVQIGRDQDLPQATRVIDAEGNYVIPGLVDCHVHLGYPSPAMMGSPTPLAEHLQKESQAAAAGGITTFVHMISALGDLVEPVKDFIRVFKENGYVDVALTANIASTDQVEQIQALADLGIVAPKLFASCRGEEAFAGMPGLDDGIIYLTFEEVARLVKEGYRIFCRVHCENVEIYFKIKDRFKQQGVEPASWHDTRPNFCEAETMYRMIYLANLLGCPLYIVHMSIKEGVDIIAKAKGDGVDVIAETCPHYLALNVENVVDKVLSKINPPIRHKEDNERLWEGIKGGVISVVATDSGGMYRQAKKDFWTAFPGFSGVETCLSIMLSEGINKGRISLQKLVEVCCYNPAQIYRLAPRKGVIEVGSDADLVIVDLNREVQVGKKPAYADADFTAYADWKMKGGPVLTMVRGKIVMEEGKIVGRPGFGKYVAAQTK